MGRAAALFALVLLAVAAAGIVYAYDQGWVLVETATPPGGVAPPPASGELRVHFVDVGQGDAVVWQLPGGAFVLYDCGPPASDEASNRVVQRLRELGATRLHALVASHGHLDHVGGCDEVLDAFVVENVYEAWYDGGDRPESYRRFQQKVLDEGARLFTLDETPMAAGETVVAAGQALALPDAAAAAGVRAELLWPAALDVADWDRIAERSLVVRLTHGDVAFCFQGDIEEAQERALAQRSDDLSCDAYLVGHHGSRYASTSEWLAKMRPRFAVVSYGENPYGHPHAEALCRVQQAGAQVWATRAAGTIVATSDGRDVALSGAPDPRTYCE